MMTDQPSGQLTLSGVDPLQAAEFHITKRDGRRDLFNEARILLAIENAFKAEFGVKESEGLLLKDVDQVRQTADRAVTIVLGKLVRGEQIQVEQIQDIVEAQLMAAGHHSVARRYILYREERKKARQQGGMVSALSASSEAAAQIPTPNFITHRNGTKERFDASRIFQAIEHACEGFEDRVSAQVIADESIR